MKALYDVPAPAKLNLFLHIVGRRADGYHLLQSVFVPIDWSDTLHFERRTDARLLRHDLGEPLPPDDLCLRAARLLQQESGCMLGADISIDKRVPSGAGMGGGSSDAASTLIALNRLWGLDWPRTRLLALGERLGADVPFFIAGGPAWVEGIGERITPLALPAQRFFVVKPAVSLPTAEIFRSDLLPRSTPLATVAFFLAQQGRFGCNDMQVVAESLSSEVGQALGWLKGRFGNSRMTGSGSAVFAWVDGQEGGTEDVTNASSGQAGSDLPAGWQGRMCWSLGQHPLREWVPD
ncbi:4-(cytidine 5'-diphospho)-2-C-methyl-D-erythritol kinase [Caldimonas tepidiphila]|uniref:4-(cytidine 5'-diphospho)-2-C-methyl-D-erythritol kinase n=1 Tax=Caldimonas tepidiphila TaxID=2315841 RepID=UPI000E5B6447|nr:4-(cytidine 5'-diphospho)-2-C-methyl-D-erythritol kinase [Caldimonas tepidiphila]